MRGIANGRVIDRAVAANRLPDRLSDNNAIIRSERLPPFGDLRRSFLASANNVELNQPGFALTRSENVPESVRRSFLRFTIECPHRRCGPSLPVSGVKQTSPIWAGMSQFDPNRTCENRIHSITLSARTSSEAGTWMPSVFAVFTFTINSKRVGWSIGSSPGSAPLRILST